MSQNLHFARIKLFDVQVLKELEYDDVLRMLKAGLGEKQSKCEELEEIFIESIDSVNSSYSAYDPKLEKLLQTGSTSQIHQNSRYYFVNQELWEAIENMIFEEVKSEIEKNIKSSEKKDRKASLTQAKSTPASKPSYEIYLKDWAVLHSLYTQKVLVFEAS